MWQSLSLSGKKALMLGEIGRKGKRGRKPAGKLQVLVASSAPLGST